MVTPPTWLEVSLIVDGELAESVAEVLARFAPDGVVIESTAVTAAPDDSDGHAVGPLRVAAYLPIDNELDDKRQRLEQALWYLGRIRPLPEAQFRTIAQTDWSEAWKAHYRPIEIGRRLLIVPAWLESPPSDRLPLRIDPGMAFGTGTHPTTQLCLELLETVFEEKPMPVIDLGTGSGILAIGALLLGAPQALGVDIDPEALPAAQENAQRNGVLDRLELGLGSLEDILAGKFQLRQAPLVMANILAPVLIRMLDANLADLLTPNGRLVLSGILAEQSGEVEQALHRHGLALLSRRQSGDWIALLAGRT